MEAGKSSQRLAWLAAIALIVSCAVGVVSIMGWIPTTLGNAGAPVVTKLAPPAVAAARCTECGVVQSVRVVARGKIAKRADSANSYEITVHFDDGTDGVFTEASAPAWRNGDEVRIVDGAIQPNAGLPS